MGVFESGDLHFNIDLYQYCHNLSTFYFVIRPTYDIMFITSGRTVFKEGRGGQKDDLLLCLTRTLQSFTKKSK